MYDLVSLKYYLCNIYSKPEVFVKISEHFFFRQEKNVNRENNK